MDYGSRFKPYYTDKNKIKYVNDENGWRPFWYVPNELQLRTYWEHIQDWGKKKQRIYRLGFDYAAARRRRIRFVWCS